MTEKQIFVDAYESARNNEEYAQNLTKIIELGRKIMSLLGPYRMLFLEYEILVGLSEKIYMENVYRVATKEQSCPTKCPTKN